MYIILRHIYNAISLTREGAEAHGWKGQEANKKEARGCIANTQLPHCACQRVHGRIGKECM